MSKAHELIGRMEMLVDPKKEKCRAKEPLGSSVISLQSTELYG